MRRESLLIYFLIGVSIGFFAAFLYVAHIEKSNTRMTPNVES